ncbi:MAG: hypothetical protein ACTTJS_05210 [Wolinella sp.]
MKLDNYVSFSIVNGFFLGLVLAILKFDEPEMIVIWTFFVTVGLYLLVLLFASFFMLFFDYDKKRLNKKRHDSTLEYFVQEFDKRERVADKVREFIRSMDLGANDDDAEVATKKS